MKKLSIISVLSILILGSSAFIYKNITDASPEYQKTEQLYASLINGEVIQESALNMFLTQMPKGGDIHHHYSGTIYVETYLDWVKLKKWSIDANCFHISQNAPDGKTLLSVDQLRNDDGKYRQLLELWSDKDYENHFSAQVPPDEQFFNTFGYFGLISGAYMHEGLNVIKERAIRENVQYIETMLSSIDVSGINYPNSLETNETLIAAKEPSAINKQLEAIYQFYVNKTAFNDTVISFVNRVKAAHEGIDGEHFIMRYQTYNARIKDPLSVYSGLIAAFEAAKQSDLIVGVNLVAAENNIIALRDYTLHMQMFNLLKEKYPNTNIALHAGELTLGMVRPKNLSFHIDQALNMGHANRIGHGIDISYETNAPELLAQMKKDEVAVEINLTSNEFILGVDDNAHPYLLYSRYGVPMVISTDDSGVSRNNLSGEYLLLASRYKPDYNTLKKYTYNSINYSFLDDDTKAKLNDRLDQEFIDFEKEMSQLFESMNN